MNGLQRGNVVRYRTGMNSYAAAVVMEVQDASLLLYDLESPGLTLAHRSHISKVITDLSQTAYIDSEKGKVTYEELMANAPTVPSD